MRRSSEGLKLLQRPAVIGEYNNYMGGVDLANMRRLHCNSTIMGQNRWWLKIFFYLLDVGTANALVLYQEAVNGTHMFDKDNKISIAEFKRRLFMGFVGPRLAIIKQPIATHVLVRTTRRHMCAYCALYSRFKYVAIQIVIFLYVQWEQEELSWIALCYRMQQRALGAQQ